MRAGGCPRAPLRLADGAWALLGLPGQDSLVRTASGGRFSIDAAHREELARIAQGLAADDAASGPAAALLLERGLAVEDASLVDPLARRRLIELGAPRGWQARAADADLLEEVRAVHAQRKLFVSFYGQTPCLPESALARVERVRRAAPPPAHVLLIGDDDFQCVPLARAGYKVTVLDIDEHLLAFLRGVTEARGLDVEVQALDLLEPLPADLIEGVDVVLTDPMSHPNCLTVFLGRGLAAVPPGGRVLTCLHVAGRPALRSVLADLPATVARWAKGLSGYYVSGFEEVAYRSDLVELERTGAALPVAGHEPIGGIDVTREDLPWPPRGLGEVIGRRLGGAQELDGEALVGALTAAGAAVRSCRCHDDGGWLHASLHLASAGPAPCWAQIALHRRRKVARFHLYPWDRAAGEALAAALSALLSGREQTLLDVYASQASPWVPALSIPSTGSGQSSEM